MRVEIVSPERIVYSGEATMVVTISRAGYVKAMLADTFRAQGRGGRGITGAKLREDDFIAHLMTTSAHGPPVETPVGADCGTLGTAAPAHGHTTTGPVTRVAVLRYTAAGANAPAPAPLAWMATTGIALFGHTGMARTLLVLAILPWAAWGATRLARARQRP